MQKSPRGLTRLCLFFCLCFYFGILHAACALGTEALRAEALDSQTLLLSWDIPSAENGTFSVSLCQEDTQRCWLAGSTVARTFLLNQLEPGARYSVHVSSGNGAQAEISVTRPGEKQSAATQTAPGSGNLGGTQKTSTVSNVSSQLLDATTLAIFWNEASSGSFTYTVTLCEADASLCRQLGSTSGTAFAIDGLTAGVACTVRIGAAGGNSIAYDFILPETNDE